MFGMSLEAAKAGFFDREKVQRAVDDATRKVLSRFGAFVRTRARTSIRWRRGTSPPGHPPYSHTGLLRRFILFAYDAESKSVVIGPTLIRGATQAPRLLEYGGTAEVFFHGQKVKARYRPRPYMRPAFEAEKRKLPPLWRNSVR